MTLERHEGPHRYAQSFQPCRASEIGQIDDETAGKDFGAKGAQQLDGTLGGAAGRNQIVNQNDALPRRATASRCISISSSPYSSEYATRTVVCGSLPFLRTGTNPAAS